MVRNLKIADSERFVDAVKPGHSMHHGTLSQLHSLFLPPYFDSNKEYLAEDIDESSASVGCADSEVDTGAPDLDGSDQELYKSVNTLLRSKQTFTLSESTSLDREMHRLQKMRRNMCTNRKSMGNVTYLEVPPKQYNSVMASNGAPVAVESTLRPKITPQIIEQQKERLRNVLKNAIDGPSDFRSLTMGSPTNGRGCQRRKHNSRHEAQVKHKPTRKSKLSETSSACCRADVNCSSRGYGSHSLQDPSMVSDRPCRKPQRLSSIEIVDPLVEAHGRVDHSNSNYLVHPSGYTLREVHLQDSLSSLSSCDSGFELISCSWSSPNPVRKVAGLSTASQCTGRTWCSPEKSTDKALRLPTRKKYEVSR
jgi:hypothetical protein